MAGPKSSLTFSSLQKYTRKRQLYAKNGFYIAINATGEVTGTSDESCLNGEEKLVIVYEILFDMYYAAFSSYFLNRILLLDMTGSLYLRNSVKEPGFAMNQ